MITGSLKSLLDLTGKHENVLGNHMCRSMSILQKSVAHQTLTFPYFNYAYHTLIYDI